MYDLAVIGGGASGLCAAIAAKTQVPTARVIIIEKLPRVGKKILATGNGRCNLSNLNAVSERYNSQFTKTVLSTYTPKRIIDFFESIGLKCVVDAEGRVYPMSNTASSVLDCLRFETERLDIEMMTEIKVDNISRLNGYFIINDSIKAKKIILATGGKASPAQGSDGSGYKLLSSLGHSVTKTFPALVQLTVNENVKSIKGCRVKAHVGLFSDGKPFDEADGELLFTDYGLSGIAVMDISRSIKDRKCKCIIDLAPKLTSKDIADFLTDRKKRNPDIACDSVLSGILPKKVGQYVLKRCSVRSECNVGSLNGRTINDISLMIKALAFDVTGTNGFSNAQITVGGARLDEFDPHTLESKKIKGLYCVGELLDVDSMCGGFNLHWAWASGLIAGINAIK